MKEFKYTDEEIIRINEFSKSFNISNVSNVIEYGKIIQDRLSILSNSLLQSSKNKDVDLITFLIHEILTEIDKMNAKKEKKSIFDFFNRQTTEQSNEVNYEKILNNLDLLQEELEKHLIILYKDLQFIELLRNNNDEYLRELNMYLIAGKYILDKSYKEREEIKDDPMKLNDYNLAIDRFEKKMYDLELTRTMTIQMIPQLNLMRDNTYSLIDKINTIIKTTITLCKNQIIILMNQQSQKKMIDEQNEISKLLNNTLEDNSIGLSEMSKDLKVQLIKGQVSDLTLQKTATDLLSIVSELSKDESKEEEKEEEQPLILEL